MTTAVFCRLLCSGSGSFKPFKSFFLLASLCSNVSFELFIEALILVSKRLLVRVRKHAVDKPVRLT